MGRVDVMFSVGVHGSFQCEEEDMERNLEDARDRVERMVEGDYPYKVGEVSVDIAGIADIDPETGDLKPRFIQEMKINGN